MNTLLFDALKAKATAEELDALARLSVYANNAVGIGEHPQITEEMEKMVQQYVDAKDKYSAIVEIEARFANQSLKS
jgi:hypothetical protein